MQTTHDIKKYLQQDSTVYYFISATNFNLMMMGDWLKNWFNINLIDCYNQQNNTLLTPEYQETPLFKDIESINHFLLGNKKMIDHIEQQKKNNVEIKILFLFYDKALEELVKSLDLKLIMPSNQLVKEIDNKITTTEIGNDVKVPSVPNALVPITSYKDLTDIIKKAQLGKKVVIQTAYGDSGKTTFFIENEDDFNQVKDKISAEKKVKIMRNINCLQVAIEACATKKGTYIGPILTEIIGHPDLTPYQGGWCGNDVNPDAFTKETQETIYKYTELLGNALYKRGYRGYFEVDYLIDSEQQNAVYLGEINPRVTGISALTNLSSFCNEHIPLFAFHLLEYSEIDFALNPVQFNQQVRNAHHKPFGQLIFKSTEPELSILTEIPATGIYQIDQNQQLKWLHYADNTIGMKKDQLFILRIMAVDKYIYKGADLVIVFSHHLMQDQQQKNLTETAKNLIKGIKSAIKTRELTEEEQQLTERYAGQASIKTNNL